MLMVRRAKNPDVTLRLLSRTRQAVVRRLIFEAIAFFPPPIMGFSLSRNHQGVALSLAQVTVLFRHRLFRHFQTPKTQEEKFRQDEALVMTMSSNPPNLVPTSIPPSTEFQSQHSRKESRSRDPRISPRPSTMT